MPVTKPFGNINVDKAQLPLEPTGISIIHEKRERRKKCFAYVTPFLYIVCERASVSEISLHSHMKTLSQFLMSCCAYSFVVLTAGDSINHQRKPGCGSTYTGLLSLCESLCLAVSPYIYLYLYVSICLPPFPQPSSRNRR